jgi:urea ABC transporter ATP-binding protein UrtE
MLEVVGLNGGYGHVPVLRNISLTVREGEILGVLGHNGMGKSTLLKTLMGLLPSSSGSVRFLGRDITRMPTHRRNAIGIGYVPQGRQIFPDLSVAENLAVGAARLGAAGGGVAEDVLQAFPRLLPLLDRRGGALSGGEQQLLALARCLCGRPKLLLLDEPTEGIQPSILDEIVDVLLRINREQGIAVLLVEQNADFLAALARRLLLIHRGTIQREVDGTSMSAERIAEVLA